MLLLIVLALPAHLNAQFHVDTLAQSPAIDFPVALAFPPDGSNKLFFTEKASGKVRIIRNDTLLPQPFVTVQVRSYGEQGLLGITFHPQYPDSPFVYIYYTRTGDSANVVARYTDSSNTGVHPQLLLVTLRLTSASSHNGGNIHFGLDGKLYVSIGDYYAANNAQDTSDNNKRGKIHRINSDGSTPSDNPFPGKTMFVYGCRNSFDFTFDSLSGKMYATENGPNCDDEINNIVAGNNYGWPIDGNCFYDPTKPYYKKPMFFWQVPPSVTGIILYRGAAFPELYGKLLVTSFNFGKIFEFGLKPSGDSVTGSPQNRIFIGSGLTDIEAGPDGYLYLANSSFAGMSRILRLRPAIAIPTPPALQYPNADTINQSLQFTCVWRQSAETRWYDLQIATDSSFINIVVDTTMEVDTAASVHGLALFTRYYWRVRGRNNLGAGEYSPMRTFRTIIAPPEIPAPVSPEADAQNQPVSLSLFWRPSARAETYGIQVATDINFNLLVYLYNGVADTMKNFPSLSYAKTYYWRVNAKNVGGSSSYSAARKFTTKIPVPAAPTLVFPPQQATEQTTELVLRWRATQYASSYHIQCSADTFFTNILADDSLLTDTTTTVPALLYSTKYYWRVRAKNAEGIGNWSVTRYFVTTLKTYSYSRYWNLISLPLKISGKTSQMLFPSASSSAYSYNTENGYVLFDTLLSGKGYWFKFDSSQSITIPGRGISLDTIDVAKGWNLIGSLSDTLATSAIHSLPPANISNRLYGFNNGYYLAEEIVPGKGYWVKAYSDCKLVLSLSSSKHIINHIHRIK